jgi:hypothetical protein
MKQGKKDPTEYPNLESAVDAYLRRNGSLFPESLEDLDLISAKLDLSAAPTPDVNKFLRYLRGEKTHSAQAHEPVVSFYSDEYAEKLAYAARNGKAIDPEIRLRMEQDRIVAEKLRYGG